MASGNTLVALFPQDNEPPATVYATFDTRNAHPVLDFDDAAATESAVFTCILPRNYAGGGITVHLHWAATTAVTGNVIWQTSFERIGQASQDIDADGFATAVTWAAVAPDATLSGNVKITNQAHTDGAQIDSIAVGESFRIKIERLGSNASDTMAGDAELVCVELKET